MLIQYSNILTLKTIKNITKIYNIKYISNLNKKDTLHILNNHICCSYIQRYFRKKLISEVCPISHEKIRYPMISIKVNKKFIYYDFQTFIKYINSANNQIDPCTRTDISDKKIDEINKIIKYYYGNNTNKTIISKNRIKNTELNIIIYCLYDLITEITEIDYMTIDNIYNIDVDPIVPIVPINHSQSKLLQQKKVEETKQKYKLYRKSALNKQNDIYKTMNLVTDTTGSDEASEPIDSD